MNISIKKEILSDFKLMNDQYLVDKKHYHDQPGRQEYRLYSYLTTFFNNIKILDIGTNTGRSAIALSHNPSNNVVSYDIVDHIKNPNHIIYSKPNVEFRIKNVLDDLTHEFIKDVKIVMIDIDHFETIEKLILDRLQAIQFSGIILLDDIKNHPDEYTNMCMKRLWDNITHPKHDLTNYGHWSGTGIVIMNSDIQITF
jgi:2-polyprenyl-3-methyl-5-hydroxy-6-metoxy-1,4-benzoquinol methylase